MVQYVASMSILVACCSGYTVVAVAGAAVSVTLTVVTVGAPVVGTVDVAASGVKPTAGSSKKKEN
ncbi:MAG: hypothetical protein J5X22_13085 [Candidatus Accumulibacter sp.]|uniref:hypothetical protein n=1 Tax=Accumulibacter sp. TaxID=2053492 RepID=UPI001ACD48B9|nr:hypothetical protein [Accumulibacter sp.]MBN8519881.1 hypothetical protein [Accumulibacter sp.]MBO3711407.1 hypothetical protein [Accumulibacter sp.]